MKFGWKRSLERRLRDDRPAPSDDLVRRISSEVTPVAQPRRRMRLGLAAIASAVLAIGLASTGGIGYAASAVSGAPDCDQAARHADDELRRQWQWPMTRSRSATSPGQSGERPPDHHLEQCRPGASGARRSGSRTALPVRRSCGRSIQGQGSHLPRSAGEPGEPARDLRLSERSPGAPRARRQPRTLQVEQRAYGPGVSRGDTRPALQAARPLTDGFVPGRAG